MSSRRKAREFALQLLFQEDLTRFPPGEIRQTFWESNPTDQPTREFAELLFLKFLENRDAIDGLIRRHAEHWRLERMATVDRNILRMSVSEFLYVDTPKIVVIDEAIEVARKYSSDESTEFVNGILDAIRRDLEQQKESNQTNEGN